MGIKKPSGVRPARVISMVWVIISMAGALMVGMVGKVFFAENPLADKETVFMDSIQALCPPVLAGILLSAILAAIMSTADSQLLVSSSAFANDIYAAFDKKASDKKLMWISRGSVIVISLIAVAIASNPDSEVFGIVSYAWAGFGAAFGPAVLFSIFWKRMNAPGVYAGIISGGLSTIIFHYLGTLNIEGFWGTVFGIYEILPAFIISSILIVVVSLLTKAPSEEIQQEFEKAKQLANAKD
jgi:sodium/proline symporter